MGQERLSFLSIHSIESDILHAIDLDDVVDQFVIDLDDVVDQLRWRSWPVC